MSLGTVAGNVGRGFAAGLVGTAAMTASSTLEAKLRGRGASSTPAEAASTALGVEPVDDEAEKRFNNLTHWGYGTGWGAARGLLGSAGLGPVAGSVAHLGAVWGAEQVLLPATETSPPATEWPAKEIAVDLLHHVVYVAVVGLAYTWLERH